MGSAHIPLNSLQGLITYEGQTKMDYKGKDVIIHYKLEVKRPIERKVIIKQYKLERTYKLFDIKKSEEMKSQLLPPSEIKHQPQETQAPKQTSKVQEQQVNSVNVKPKHESEPEVQVPEEPKEPKISHQMSKDLKALGTAEFTQYLGQLKAAKPLAEKQGIELPKLVEYDKDSFSCKFMAIYISELEDQQEKFIEKQPSDMKAAEKCKNIFLALSKKKAQIERNIQGGKLTPDVYLGCLKNEYDEAFQLAKFVKKCVKNNVVFAFLFAKCQILDGEIKELEEFLKNN